jgi:hypothetical protein
MFQKFIVNYLDKKPFLFDPNSGDKAILIEENGTVGVYTKGTT